MSRNDDVVSFGQLEVEYSTTLSNLIHLQLYRLRKINESDNHLSKIWTEMMMHPVPLVFILDIIEPNCKVI